MYYPLLYQSRYVDNNFTFLDNSGNSNPKPDHLLITHTCQYVNTLWIGTHRSEQMMTPQPPTHMKPKQLHSLKLLKGPEKQQQLQGQLREPDPFDNSDSHKLCTFILQCKLNFRDCKDLFKDDTDKVNYVLSFLKGIALDCFESAILDAIKPAWLSDFDLFLEELEPILEPTIQSAKQKLNSKTLHARQPPGYEVLYQVPAASHTRSVGWCSTPLSGLQWSPARVFGLSWCHLCLHTSLVHCKPDNGVLHHPTERVWLLLGTHKVLHSWWCRACKSLRVQLLALLTDRRFQIGSSFSRKRSKSERPCGFDGIQDGRFKTI